MTIIVPFTKLFRRQDMNMNHDAARNAFKFINENPIILDFTDAII